MITQERLKQLLDYDPLTGVFLWKPRPNSTWCGKGYVGGEAGSLNRNGYLRIGIDGKLWLSHRLAWLWVHGAFPVRFTDHVNGNKADNRIENLREADDSQNQANASIRGKNVSGFKGVVPSRRTIRPWAAYIRHHGKKYYLGSYETPEMAHDAYLTKARELHGEFARAA